jgi:hypothetical protein
MRESVWIRARRRQQTLAEILVAPPGKKSRGHPWPRQYEEINKNGKALEKVNITFYKK